MHRINNVSTGKSQKVFFHFTLHGNKLEDKHEQPVLCTNAIRASSSEIYCSTHLIMNGMKDPKNSTKKEAKNNMKV